MTLHEVCEKSELFLNSWVNRCKDNPTDMVLGYIYLCNGKAHYENDIVPEQIFWHMETYGKIIWCGRTTLYFPNEISDVYKISGYPISRYEKSRKPLTTIEKARVFAKCDFKCVKCNSEDNLQIDHIFPVSKGGGNDPGNLQILCRTCNIKKRDRV